jgi:Icc protein
VYGQVSDDNLDTVLTRSTDVARQPDVVVCSGDVADDASTEAYRRTAERLRAVAETAVWVPGNHDVPALMTALAPRGFPDTVRAGSWQLVLLDSSWAGHNEGQLGEAQLARLDVLLGDTDRHVAVVVHHPPVPACGDPECQLSDADDLLDVLNRHHHVRTVLSGHNHRPFDIRRSELRLLGAPSTCRQAHHDPPRHAWTDEGPAARSITLVADGTIDTDVLWAQTPPAQPHLEWWS